MVREIDIQVQEAQRIPNKMEAKRKKIPLPSFMSTCHASKVFGYYLSYTVIYIPMAIL